MSNKINNSSSINEEGLSFIKNEERLYMRTTNGNVGILVDSDKTELLTDISNVNEQVDVVDSNVTIINDNMGVTLGSRLLTEQDDSGRIERAIAMASKSKRVVRLSPNITYTISRQIDLPARAISFICEGMATIKAIAPMDSMFKCSSFIEYPIYEGLILDASGLANYCLYLEFANTPNFVRNHFKNPKIAALALGKDGQQGVTVYESRFSKMKITGGEQWNTAPENISEYGILLLGGASDNHLDDILIKNVKYAGIRDRSTNNHYGIIHIFGYPEPEYSPDYGIDLVAGRATITGGLYTDGIKKAGIKMRAGFNIVQGGSFFWRFDSEWDKTQTSGIEIDDGVYNYVISNCIFRGAVGYDVRHLGNKSGVVFGNVSVSVLNQSPSYLYDGSPVEFGSAIRMSNNLSILGTLNVGNKGISTVGSIAANGDITALGKMSARNGLSITQTTGNVMAFEMSGKDASKYVNLSLTTGSTKRWDIQKNNGTEDLLFISYTDEGTQRAVPMKIIRATGETQFTGDIRTTSPTNGLVLTSPNGAKWRQTIDNNGVTSWKKI